MVSHSTQQELTSKPSKNSEAWEGKARNACQPTVIATTTAHNLFRYFKPLILGEKDTKPAKDGGQHGSTVRS